MDNIVVSLVLVDNKCKAGCCWLTVSFYNEDGQWCGVGLICLAKSVVGVLVSRRAIGKTLETRPSPQTSYIVSLYASSTVESAMKFEIILLFMI